MKRILIIITMTLLLVGCSNNILVKNISGNEANELINNNNAIIIDVRSSAEYESGHIKNSINVPIDTIDLIKLEELSPSKDNNIIVYCASGGRSKNAAMMIANFGYVNVYDLGSINNWEGEIE